ncbi:hypothetical protein BHE74_00042170 [Ensete ventricosum]|nr:hypothetical protein BHE74_00042170 [Ensete ventricosum]
MLVFFLIVVEGGSGSGAGYELFLGWIPVGFNCCRSITECLARDEFELVTRRPRLHALLTIKESAANVPRNLEARRRWYIPVPRLPVRGPPATERFRQRSTVDGRLKGEIDHRRSIEGEIDRRRSIEREKGRKKKKRKKKKRPIARAPSSLSRGSLALFLPRGEKDRGDLRFWASYRGQTLARTEARAQADLKFTYVVTCQIYGKQKEEQKPEAADIAMLMQRFVYSVHTGLPSDRYVDRPLSGGTA